MAKTNPRKGKVNCNEKRNSVRKPITRDEVSDRNDYRGRRNTNSMGVDTSTNDKSWYSRNPELLKAGASFAYGYPVGSPAYLDNAEYPDAGKLIVSGIAAIEVIPTLGLSKDASSPLNQAIRKMYTYIRHANSGAKNYDPADLGLYIGAMDQIYTMFWYGVRAYGTARLYNAQNRYVPYTLLNAQGFDADDVMKNCAQLRYGLNRIATIVNNLVTPNDLPLLARHRWIFSGLFSDGTSPKSQIYMYRPAGYFTFGLDEQGAGMLKYTSLSTETKSMTVNEYLALLDEMVNPILTNYDEDFGIISGDIMKAYDANSLYKLPAVPEEFAIAPEYSEEVLSQIQNATLLGNYIHDFNYRQVVEPNAPNAGALIHAPALDVNMDILIEDGITVKPNVLVQSPNFVSAAQSRLISLNITSPEPGDTMVATRLTAMVGAPGSMTAESINKKGKSYVRVKAKDCPLLTAGTEWATRAYIYKVSGYGTAYKVNAIDVDMDAYLPDVTFGIENAEGNYTELVQRGVVGTDLYLKRSVRLSHFRFHPMVVATMMNLYMTVQNSAIKLVKCSELENFYNFEIDNYTVLSESDLDQLNEIAVLSLLNI